MDHPSSPDAPVENLFLAKARFWVGPLVAGCCFALGYGITERVLTLQTNAEDPVPEAFTPLAFPGDSLQEIRARFSDDDSSLQVDVTALEAAEAASRTARSSQRSRRRPNPLWPCRRPNPRSGQPPPGRTPKPLPPDEEDNGPAPSSAQEPELTMTATPIPWCFLRSPLR